MKIIGISMIIATNLIEISDSDKYHHLAKQGNVKGCNLLSNRVISLLDSFAKLPTAFLRCHDPSPAFGFRSKSA